MDKHFRMLRREAIEVIEVSSEDVGSSPLYGLGYYKGIHGMSRSGRRQ